jgi:hypothetical protein
MILDKRFSYHVLVDMAVHTFKAGRNQCSCSVGPLPDVHSSVQNTWMLFLRLPTPTLYSRFSMCNGISVPYKKDRTVYSCWDVNLLYLSYLKLR